MNNITVDHLLELVSQIIPGSTYDYARPGANKARLISVDVTSAKIQMARVSEDGSLTQSSIASDSLNTLASRIVEDTPISIDEALLNGGNQRSVIEALLLRTAEFYSCKVGRNKTIVWVPSKPHKVGEHLVIDMSDLHPDNNGDNVLYSISELFVEYLINEGKSEATIDRYVKQVPNNNKVREHVHLIAGKKELFDVIEISKLHKISQAVASEDFDKNGGNMYSAGINAYAHFISNYYLFLKHIRKGNKGMLVRNSSPAKIPHQQVYYGAPGTGKSHIINELTKGESVIRTTFHPDSDYSTFVGAYKPTIKEVVLRDLSGHPVKENGITLTEDRIIYEFVDQAFLQAYVQAWKYYAETDDSSEPKKQYLIIEEINRGNCAQIFGDLFQLLDRNASGFSDYPINADNDMKKQLAKAFKGHTIAQADRINACYKGKDVTSKVLSGEILLLPNNLYIWATMNTSDQSLFPIDSAFKRRWDWQYMPICKGRDENGNELNWKIAADTKEYDWWSFLAKINDHINSTTNSEDKKLGFFFCKPQDGCISSETFVGKVIFYLWNDVFKDFGFEGPIFKDVDGSELSFNKFYKSDDKGMAVVQKDKVELFLNNLGVDVVKDNLDSTEEREEDEDGNDISSPSTGRDYTKFSINGVGSYGKNNLAAECVKKYIELNPDKTADEVLREWMSLGNIVPHFIETKEQFDARTDNSKRSHEIPCGDTALYVAHNGYGNNGKVQVLIDAVNNKSWGITLSKA